MTEMMMVVASGFDVDAAVGAYLATVSGEARENSDAYFVGGYWLLLWGLVVTTLTYWLFLKFGWSQKISDWAERKSGARTFLADWIYLVIFFIATSLILLPWSIYTDFIREHQYGLATQNFGSWLGEAMMGAVISILIFPLLIAGILKLVRKFPGSWWAWGSGLMISFLLFFMLVAPVVISPLFNDYTPMAEGELKTEIISMARASGVPADNVYVVDQSRQTTRISANVQGLGPTIRISLNDNLLEQGSREEIRAVMGHEIGHYVLNHSIKMVTVFVLLILALFGFLNWAGRAVIRRYGTRWELSSIGHRSFVPVALILIGLFFFLATPVTNSIIRVNEQEADVFGLNAAREPDGFASIAMKLSTYRKLDPGRWEELIFFDHPSGRVRAETAMQWKAENLGATPGR